MDSKQFLEEIERIKNDPFYIALMQDKVCAWPRVIRKEPRNKGASLAALPKYEFRYPYSGFTN